MKRILFIASFAAITLASCSSATDRIKPIGEASTSSMLDALPVINFEEEFHDFGEVQEGDVVEHTFVFTNEGDGPLIISNAEGSCGCTVPDWPRQPIAPGQKGQIQVSFNSENRAGRQDKRVTLTTNAVPQTKVLNITSNVIANKE
ncbi:MAG: DUF1573 domain-containing protein [Schleiferiaceae bacterium]|nr:DUF1573 domain-containing protein [Schleiferiaceae bacterium]